MSSAVFGWDIGGVNTKCVRLIPSGTGPVVRGVSRPFELQHFSKDLPSVLTEVAAELGVQPTDFHAVTMTAELSQAFRTKREGVGFILDALATAMPTAGFHIYTVDGRFVQPEHARLQPLRVGGANWVATANLVSRSHPTAILIDIGSTSADLIPIVNGRVSTQGFSAALAAEGFALMGDVHLWLGRLQPEEYTCSTPDGRPATREFAGERLARAVCGDREMLGESEIDAIALALARAQVRSLEEALRRIRGRCPDIATAVTAGLGDFIATEAGYNAGLNVVPLSHRLGPAARVAPAAAVAWLLWQSLGLELC